MLNQSAIRTTIFLSFLCAFSIAVSQVTTVTTAIPFVQISPSPEANGQGCASVSRITDDPYAINYNPAQLGFSSNQTNLMLAFYPTKTPWLPGLDLDLTYNSYVLSGGTNLEEYLNFPVSIGLAYSRVKLDLGTFNRTSSSGPEIIGFINGEEHTDAFSIGIGLSLGIKIALGITFRRIESNFVEQGVGQEQGNGSASAWSRDYGLLLNIPITELLLKKSESPSTFTPIMDISFGTSLSNEGDKMIYIDQAQADPLPRSISIGSTVNLGINYTQTDLMLLSFSWSRQADNLLVGRDGINTFYRGGFGDIDYFKNIIAGKQSETIDLAQGWQIGFGETLYIREGSFVGTGNRSFKTEGIGFRMTGLFKLLKHLNETENSALFLLTKHFDLRYDQSVYKTIERFHPLDKTTFSALIFTFKF